MVEHEGLLPRLPSELAGDNRRELAAVERQLEIELLQLVADGVPAARIEQKAHDRNRFAARQLDGDGVRSLTRVPIVVVWRQSVVEVRLVAGRSFIGGDRAGAEPRPGDVEAAEQLRW